MANSKNTITLTSRAPSWSKYVGITWREICISDPAYARWCIEKFTHIKRGNDVVNFLKT